MVTLSPNKFTMDVKIEFSPLLLPSEKDDEDKEKDKDKEKKKAKLRARKFKEIVNTVCAILNTSKQSVKFILVSKDYAYTDKNEDDIARAIEQKLEVTFGVGTTKDVFKKLPQTTKTNCDNDTKSILI